MKHLALCWICIALFSSYLPAAEEATAPRYTLTTENGEIGGKYSDVLHTKSTHPKKK